MNIEIDYLRSLENVSYIAACDEVGRGPLIGPVVAGCVLFSDLSKIQLLLDELSKLGISDSKKLSPQKRQKILNDLKIDVSEMISGVKYSCMLGNILEISFSVVEVSAAKIDEINILNASLLAMKEAFEAISKSASKGLLLIDGNKKWQVASNVLAECIVKGDSKSLLIGLASIIAKEYRDWLMKNLDQKYPQYGLAQNSGYPTAEHRKMISIIGPTPDHRKTFAGVREFL